jgi:alpha-mannosidase
VDIFNNDYGVSWFTCDAPLMELGTITANLPATQPNPRAYLEHIAPTQTLYSWVMNNHWHTNYKADQEGPTTFRYLIVPHERIRKDESLLWDIDGADRRFCNTPPSARFAVTAFKPSDDGKAWILRLFGASGKDAVAELEWAKPEPTRITYSDASEQPGQPAPARIPVPAWGIVTLRAERP